MPPTRFSAATRVASLTLGLMAPHSLLLTAAQAAEPGEMAGYLIVDQERAPKEYNAGFSMYVAAWPLQQTYPGSDFQTGLFGTWMFAQHDAEAPDRIYSDIEGGLGWWRDTRFATETPKFIMGGVELNFIAWANGPGAGKGRDWSDPRGHYGIAQLSSRVLWPPDGLNLAQGTCGEFFGYGYLPLPLTHPKSVTAGQPIPTGNHCWTLFLNTRNFKGPVAFFTPFFWSSPTIERPDLAGLFLDSRPSEPNRALQMETQHIPCVQGVSDAGDTYVRIAPTLFPAEEEGVSSLVHRITSYDKTALWDAVQAWFDGGAAASGELDPAGAYVHAFTGRGGATWRAYSFDTPDDARAPIAWDSFAAPLAAGPETFAYRWDEGAVTSAEVAGRSVVVLPEYYRLERDDEGAPRWAPVRPEEAPPETGLRDVTFDRPERARPEPYVTPDEPTSCWKTPGPVAGPHQARLGDGSVVTYYWYRFADQPALQNADLTDAEREELQVRVEMLHRAWSIDRDYLAPPSIGELAALDPALIVTPPAGLEVGYVPIATRQELAE